MRQPLRTQIFLPFGVLAVVVVTGITLLMATLAARSRQAEAIGRLTSVVDTLRTAQFPFTSAVLQQMHGLSNADFIVQDAAGLVTATTLPSSHVELPKNAFVDALERLPDEPTIQVGDLDYFAARLPLKSTSMRGDLLVLLPVRAWRRLGWEAAWPPVAAGVTASLAALVLAGGISRRLTRRLDAIRRQVLQIAEGTADHLSLNGPDDELRELATAVNSVSDQLRQHERTIRQTERMRLVAQLSSGLAHQLRNAASGARLAVQLIQRRHPDVAEKEVHVAMTQLEIIEDHIRRLLSVGPERPNAARHGSVDELFRSVEQLTAPTSRHSGVELHFDPKTVSTQLIPDLDGIRAGLLNIVMNGVEAAGRGGRVNVAAAESRNGRVTVTVSDSGEGPSDDIAERMFEPFVTSKPEGVGLGLAYVRRTIELLGGAVSWSRQQNETCFVLELPTWKGDL